nr:hypothetical protein GCM10020092_061170 [Actinoplanes digitatis]
MVAAFVLIHGAGDVGWYWHLVEAELRARGHETIAPDLPCEDDSAGLPSYADVVVDAIGGRTGLIVVAQSFGGFIAPLVCDRVAVELLVLVAPMIPAPGESPAAYWAATGYDKEPRAGYDDTIELFYQDVAPELAAEALRRGARPVRGPDGGAVAAAGLARRTHPGPDLPRRPPVPGPLPAPRRARTPGRHPRRDRRWAHARAQPPPRELADRLEAYAATVVKGP